MSATQRTSPNITPRLLLKHILVPTDFSDASRSALKQAAAIARLHGSDLVVLHIVPPEPYILGIGTPVPKASRHGMEQKLAGAIDCYLLARKSTHGTARRGALEERYRDDNDCTRSDFLHLSF